MVAGEEARAAFTLYTLKGERMPQPPRKLHHDVPQSYRASPGQQRAAFKCVIRRSGVVASACFCSPKFGSALAAARVSHHLRSFGGLEPLPAITHSAQQKRLGHRWQIGQRLCGIGAGD